jgi:hypothetical protein
MRLACAFCWVVLGSLALGGIALVALVAARMAAAPLAHKSGAALECAFVAELEAERQQAWRANRTPLRPIAYVSPLLHGEPKPWRIQEDDNLQTRLRLWATGLRDPSLRPAVDCGAAFTRRGLALDPGEGRRTPEGPHQYSTVSTYSRPWFGRDRSWALMAVQVCAPSPRATNWSLTRETAIYETTPGWTRVASDSQPTTLELRRLPSPSRCPAPTR